MLQKINNRNPWAIERTYSISQQRKKNVQELPWYFDSALVGKYNKYEIAKFYKKIFKVTREPQPVFEWELNLCEKNDTLSVSSFFFIFNNVSRAR
jgi:hypothetical protein